MWFIMALNIFNYFHQKNETLFDTHFDGTLSDNIAEQNPIHNLYMCIGIIEEMIKKFVKGE